MKYIYGFLIVVSLACFLGLASLSSIQARSEGKLRLSLDSSKTIYKPGETVLLSFELKNQSKEVVSIADTFGIGGGMLSVHISKDGRVFENYGHPGWGLVDSFINPSPTIKPGESVKSTASVLWKWRGADNAEYAFPTPGEYYLKARYIYDNTIVNGRMQPVIAESELLKIRIEEPLGDDLDVWNKIKGNADFAFFIQEGDIRIPTYRKEERERFEQDIVQILDQYPNSSYAGPLRHSLNKFRTNEAKILESMKKMQMQKPE